MDDKKRDGRLSSYGADETELRDKASDDELSDEALSDVGGGVRPMGKNPDEDAGPDGRYMA